MVSTKFLLQAATPRNHITAVEYVLSIPAPRKVLISVAFLTEGGIRLLEGPLTRVAARTVLIVGIRNGLTSAQGLKKSLAIGCSTYAVDTGTRKRIFHPKLYLSRNDVEARLIVGSANLTTGGLNGNIEASLLLKLDLRVKAEAALAREAEAALVDMIREYPTNVLRIRGEAAVQQLLDSGRAVDESQAEVPTPAGSSGNRDLDTVPQMALKTQSLRMPPTLLARRSRIPASAGAVVPAQQRLTEVWESTPLTRRDLTIPRAENTNPTGSMLFKKGNSEIDQQKYFRTQVFNRLAWRADPRTPGKELAEAEFQLVIRSVDYGVHTLTVTNDTRRNTKSFAQLQPMSALRWGGVRELIAREDLLGRTMRLYRDEARTNAFVIEID